MVPDLTSQSLRGLREDFRGLDLVRTVARHRMIRVSVPAILESDPPDVVVALRTAQRVYRNEPLDAIDWVRQAAQLAQDAGLDARAIELAVAASDLLADLKSSATMRMARQEAITLELDMSAHREPKQNKG